MTISQELEQRSIMVTYRVGQILDDSVELQMHNDEMQYLGQTNNLIMEFEFEMQKLQESATLFEVPVPEFKQIEQCRKEVKMLKQLWDYIFLVRTCIDDWKTTMWRDIDVENMDMELGGNDPERSREMRNIIYVSTCFES